MVLVEREGWTSDHGIHVKFFVKNTLLSLIFVLLVFVVVVVVVNYLILLTPGIIK